MKFKPRVINENTSLKLIHKAICYYFNIEHDNRYDFFEKTRKKNVVKIRQWFQYFSVKLNPRQEVSYAYIGYYGVEEANVKHSDHATVIHSYKTISNLIDVYKDDYETMLDISAKIKMLKNPNKIKLKNGNCAEKPFEILNYGNT